MESDITIKSAEAVATINQLSLSRPPRTISCYSNGTYNVVGELIDCLSGQPYTAFIEERILAPLKMHSTRFLSNVDSNKIVKLFVSDYDSGNSQEIGQMHAIAHKSCWMQPNGGMLSTAADMGIWLQYLLRLANCKSSALSHTIIKPTTFVEILRTRILATEQIGAIPVEAGKSHWKEMAPSLYALGQLCFNYRYAE